MINFVMKKIFGSQNERYLKTLRPMVARVNELEPETARLADADFPSRMAEYKRQVAAGKSLDAILPEVFALVREAGKRALNMRHFDVQLVGGAVLHQGKIAEMKTGEGKTLVATLPVALNALTGRGVHVITVNDYLARRDAEWMGQIYKFLGLSVGVILHGLNPDERRESYGSDVIYGTNNEFGFDYLRDNMAFSLKHVVQRELHYAIVDEVDSILIDEARTPLIISGQAEESTSLYRRIDALVPRLAREADFDVDEKARSVTLSEDGVVRCEELLGVENLYDPRNITFQHHILQALKAHNLFKRDVDYIVKDGEVVIVDEFTGRLMPGRRYSEGLHQALEAKEKVEVKAENQTLASITFQNYFRMYDKLAGMTGTADTEAVEFKQIYNLDVAVIPTNMPMVRADHPDLIYKTQREKFSSIADDIEELHKLGQPVLVGTVSIEKSEMLSELLKKRRVPHNVLNAKQHEREAEIVAEAGQKGKVTIATNMAGRGTDIKLGEGVVDVGGLHILGTERHESRRIDNQLRGRSGRQGDPGESRFYLAAEDELIRLFAGDRMYRILDRLGPEEGMPIEARLLSSVVEKAQKKVEELNFLRRKNVLKYDEVMNEQRRVVYDQRQRILNGEDFGEQVHDMIAEIVEDTVREHLGDAQFAEEWDVDALLVGLRAVYDCTIEKDEIDTEDGDLEDVVELAVEDALEQYQEREKLLGEQQIRDVERAVMLEIIDGRWKDHLLDMDYLQEGIHLRALGQRDPLVEYKNEGYVLFQDMLESAKRNTVTTLMKNRPEDLAVFTAITFDQPVQMFNYTSGDDLAYQTSFTEAAMAGGEVAGESPPGTAPAVEAGTGQRRFQEAQAAGGGVAVKQRVVEQKIGRNDPCWCGSGKKYKKCHGA